MTDLQNVELDLLIKFQQICEKYNLKYYASSGTLLGAVRHKGFIPWDDDIDVFLMWKDYQKLLEVAPKECTYPYFFQSYLTDSNSEASASRLRRSDTTGFTKWEAENCGDDYNKGIFIDIFPLFYVSDSKLVRYFQKKTIMFFWKCIRGHNALQQISRGQKVNETYRKYIPYYKFISKFLNITSIKEKYLKACAISFGQTKTLGATSSRVHQENLMWKAADYEKIIELPFENVKISCPFQYEKVLTKQYGDWKTPVKNGARHEMVAVDTKNPCQTTDKK